ncbi:MAG: right-handed parallel beta-helix repeat-containing protein [Anaerolineae bacterium]|nr:right-handed parallel beta-helix repeat-containing protein [Thermoflexus sp.]MDW8180269.1 right-handed parallel beta-helix repeat-containing protein [Anaerolineae bacterium]
MIQSAGGAGIGVYTGSVTVAGTAQAPVIVQGNGDGTGIYVDSTGRAIVGPAVVVHSYGMGISVSSGGAVTVTGGWVLSNTQDGLYVMGRAVLGSGAVVRGNGGNGIAVASGGAVTVTRSEVLTNTRSGILTLGAARIGPDVAVQGNGANGIVFSGADAAGVVMTSTVRHNGGVGIQVYNARGILISGNRIEGNGDSGIAASGNTSSITTDLVIAGNTIISNAGPGINFWGASGNIVVSNAIGVDGTLARLNMGSGVSMANGARNNEVRGNAIGYNQYQNVLISGSGTEGNIVRDNRIFSDACGQPSQHDNSGVIVAGGARNNTIGPGNRIFCHRYSGIQIIGPETDGNRIVDNHGGPVSSCALSGVLGPAIACNGQGVALFNEPGNTSFPSVSPGNSRPAGPRSTVVQNNLIISSTYDGVYAVLVTDTYILTNTIQGSGGSGALLVGSAGVFRGNQVRFNAGDGIRLEPHYGLQRDPATAADDVVSDFWIEHNIIASNAGAGIHGLDTKADPSRGPDQLNLANIIIANGWARIVQEWLGAVEVLDGSTPISAGLVITLTASSGTCGAPYVLTRYNGGAWGPVNNGLGYGPFQLQDVGTWAVILDHYVDDSGNYRNCNPYTIEVGGVRRGSARFSFDGNAFTDPVDPDLNIPYSRPLHPVNGRYQVAQLRFLRLFLPLVLRSWP